MRIHKLLPMLLTFAFFVQGCSSSNDAAYRSFAPQVPAQVNVPVYVPPPTCFTSSPEQTEVFRQSQSSPFAGDDRSVGTDRKNDNIAFTVSRDGPAQRVEWRSMAAAGEGLKICFETNGKVIQCDNVSADAKSGTVYVFGDTNLSGATARFRLIQ